MAYELNRSDFGLLLSGFSLLFLAYLVIIKSADHRLVFWLGFAGAFAFRLIYMPAIPALSDDIYRFIWDGRLLAQGIDPFKYLPSHYITGEGQAMDITGINKALYEKLNSPEYYTIYPPLAQWVFTLSAFLFPESIMANTVLIRVILLLFEIGNILLIIWLLRFFRLPLYLVLLYALNPLVIAEITGNLHFEGVMIFGLLLAFVMLCKNRLFLSSLAFSVAVMAKLLPLIFLPLLIRRIGMLKTIGYGFLALFITFLSFLTVTDLSQFYHMFQSLELYFQTFEFNASFYYLLRWFGFMFEGYNMINTLGKILPILTVLGIGIFAWKEDKPDKKHLPQAIVGILTIYLIFSTTVHPWYIIALLPFSLFTRFRFPFLWSYLIILSYATYRTPAYQENLWLTALEYLLVFTFLVIEWLMPSLLTNSHFRVFTKTKN